MPLDMLTALIVFAFVTSVTPGPNNLMLLASGANFGFRRTIPHMLGIGSGFLVLLLAVGFGLGEVFDLYPPLYTALKFAGGAYLLYLAWRLATATGLGEAKAGARPLTFLEAAAFQWVNPKAWVMAMTAMAAYTVPALFTLSVLVVGLVFALVNVPSVSVWALFGVGLRTVLSDRRRLRAFNVVMAALLVASLWPIVT